MYKNPWPDSRPPRFALLRWMFQRRLNGVPPDPDPVVLPLARPAFPVPRAPADRLTATWVGHATTLIQVGGRNVLTDPVFGDRASPVSFAGPRRRVAPGVALAELPPIDLVLLSHNHYDHLDRTSVHDLAAWFPNAPWLVPPGLAKTLRRAGGREVREVREVGWWESVTLDGVTVTGTPARHFSGRNHLDRNRSFWCGFALAGGSHRVYFAADTGYHPDFGQVAERLGPFDLAMLPIGAYLPRWLMQPVHLDPDEAVRAFLDLGGRDGGVMMGIHWGTFKLSDEPMDEPPVRTREAWKAAGLPAERLWVPMHGETREISCTVHRAPETDERSVLRCTVHGVPRTAL